MAAELLLALARCNLAAGVAIVAVLALRGPLRRWLGAQRAYAVWPAVPLAAAGSLMPGDFATGAPGAAETANIGALTWLAADGHAVALTTVWLSGALAGIAVAAWRHCRFSAALRAGCAGPAAVGVFQPRLVTPADFAARFTPEQRRLVRAHELAHMDRRDALANAGAALATWACWFNPLAHLAARAMRLDQELACDAAVLERVPGARRLYAQTLLNTHQATATPVLGCQWRSGPAHPLETRIRSLGWATPGRARHDLGVAVLLASWTATFAVAWALQPPLRLAEPPMVILVQLAPPSAAEAMRGAEVYRMAAVRDVRRP